MLIPKSERFDRLTAPIIERIFGSSPAQEEPAIELYILQPLQKGDKGEEVVKLQNFLREQGYTKLRADGDYGPATQKTVEAFQQAQGLEATGIVDSLTIVEISKIVATRTETNVEETQPETPVEPIKTVKPEQKPKPAKKSKPVETPQPKPQPEPKAESAPAQQTTSAASDVPSVRLDDLIKVINQNNNP